MSDAIPSRAAAVAPILQADPHDGCEPATSAFIAGWFGYPRTEQQVSDWHRIDGSRVNHFYPSTTRGIHMARWTGFPHAMRARWFLHHPEADKTCSEWLDAGAVANVLVHRVPQYAHAVVLVGIDMIGQTVEIMDPLSGYVTEPWSWFRGRPDENQGHFIQAWFWSDAVDRPGRSKD